jgi:hypothetical protein
LESLLKIKQAVDTTGLLQHWDRTSGDYCKWDEVTCADGTKDVIAIQISAGSVEGLTGVLPPGSALAGLEKLTSISIRQQPGINGTLPADWAKLTGLEAIQLADNSLTGGIPWEDLIKLKTLDLADNAFAAMLPASLGNLQSLKSLKL